MHAGSDSHSTTMHQILRRVAQLWLGCWCSPAVPDAVGNSLAPLWSQHIRLNFRAGVNGDGECQLCLARSPSNLIQFQAGSARQILLDFDVGLFPTHLCSFCFPLPPFCEILRWFKRRFVVWKDGVLWNESSDTGYHVCLASLVCDLFQGVMI